MSRLTRNHSNALRKIEAIHPILLLISWTTCPGKTQLQQIKCPINIQEVAGGHFYCEIDEDKCNSIKWFTNGMTLYNLFSFEPTRWTY